MFKVTLQQRIYLVIAVVVIVLAASFSLLIYYVIRNEEAKLIQEKAKASSMMSQTILHTIYKDMLDERADMAYHLMQSVKKIKGMERVQIVRSNGVEAAFADDKTLKEVEEEYGELKPEWKTPRISHGGKNVADGVDYPKFKEALQFFKDNPKNIEPIHFIEERTDKRLFTYLEIIKGRQKCSACHKETVGFRAFLMISISLEDTYAALKESRNNWTWFGIVTIAVVSLILGTTITVGVTRPIKQTVSMLGDIAEVKGDLTKRLTVKTEDEIGKVALWFNKFVEGMQETVKVVKTAFGKVVSISGLLSASSQKVRQSAEQQLRSTDDTSSAINELETSMKSVTGAAEHIHSSMDNVASSVIEMSASSEEISGNMEKLSSSVETTTSSIMEISASVKEVANSIEMLSDIAEKIASSITQIHANIKEIEKYTDEQTGLAEDVKNYATSVGMDSVKKTMTGMTRIREDVTSASAVIKKLGERSEAVGSMLNVINNVAETTSLLALNAAILAAQAGEHGKGFAVVANETKNLASKTATSTKEIAGIIEAFHGDIADAINSIGRSSAAVEEGVAASSEALTVLETIGQSTDQTAGMAKKVGIATREQAQGVNLVTETIQKMGQMIEELKRSTDEQRRGTEGIIKASENMSDITKTVKTSTQQQAKESKYTSEIVSDVAQKIKAIAKTIDEQRVAVSRIAKTVELVKRVGEDNVNLAAELDKTVEKLNEQAAHMKEGMDKFKV
ncbi:MAG: methyl-accepting chemotaxis protein [Deltaproteobacteria bacterium]|nr:methyl-accepting chemotaxis protein [Deltaproteobacteria bacterium]